MDKFNASSPRQRGPVSLDTDLPSDLRLVVQRYQTLPVPRPTAEDTARLVARLLAEEPAAALALSSPSGGLLAAVRVARWRVRLLGAQFWIASVLLMLVGAAWSQSLHTTTGAAPLIFLIPLTAVLGLSHALRTSSGGLRAVETSSPLGFVEVTAGLALAIVGFDCLLGVIATSALALARWAPFGLLLAAWLGPLLLLTGISLPIALRWGAIPAAVIGGGPWLLLAATAQFKPVGLFALPQGTLSLTLHLLAALSGLSLLLLTYLHNPRWLNPSLPQGA